jgi:hypothetical protein
VWDVSGPVSDELKRTILNHLEQNCAFEVRGDDGELTGELLSFYADTVLCQLVLPKGAEIRHKRGQRERLEEITTFYFLFRHVAGDQLLIPLAGGCGNIHLANHYLGLRLDNDLHRMAYARFYCAFGRVGKPPQFVNAPQELSDVRFVAGAPSEKKWLAYGAMWRFLDRATRTSLDVRFETRGLFAAAGHRAHLPLQLGRQLIDADLKIWRRDGHITYKPVELVYENEALAREPEHVVGRISLPKYIKRSERMRAGLQNLKASLRQFAYLLGTGLFLLASGISLLFPLELFGISLMRSLLEAVAALVPFANWMTLLCASTIYCIAYFVLTTFLVLDTETIRNGLLTLRPSLQGGMVDEWLHNIARRQNRSRKAQRLALWKRIALALTFLFFWSLYLVLVFTSLQASLMPASVATPEAMLKVMTIFVEQAALYVPVVVYYVGRSSLDPVKLALISYPLIVAFRLIIGLLVVRRIHRFWASTARSRLHRL